MTTTNNDTMPIARLGDDLGAFTILEVWQMGWETHQQLGAYQERGSRENHYEQYKAIPHQTNDYRHLIDPADLHNLDNAYLEGSGACKVWVLRTCLNWDNVWIRTVISEIASSSTNIVSRENGEGITLIKLDTGILKLLSLFKGYIPSTREEIKEDF